jgi:anti-anti-sigma regulatory factor
MLRITVHNNSQPVTFQLEGRLSGPWLEELDKCWQRTLSANGKSIIRVDLTGLTFVDSAGKAYLKAMHQQRAQFVAADCLTKSIVDEITSGSDEGRIVN